MIRKLRKDRGLRLEDLAQLLGITSMEMSRIERSQRNLKVSYAKILGDFFGIDWYLFYDNSPE